MTTACEYAFPLTTTRRRFVLTLVRARLVLLTMLALPLGAQQPNWPEIEAETMRHFQALLRINTADPPGTEKEAVEYLKQVLEREGISVQTYALATDPHRPNLVARLRGNGSKRPLLIMGH